MKSIYKAFTLFFLVLILTSCYTSKKADRQLNKAKINYPSIVAEKMALWYPYSQNKGTSDSSQYKSFIQQIDSLNRLKIDSIYFYDTLTKIDTKIDTLVKLKDCNDIIYKYKTIYKNIPAIHDTTIVTSTADKYIIQQMINEREEAHKKYDKSTKLNIWLLIALIVSIITHIFKKR